MILLVTITIRAFSQDVLPNYVEFLKKQQSPKEYIFELWKDADIIVLGERDHRDTTQYNLILDIISDKRFIDNVRYLYLEVGVINATGDGNALIKEHYNDQSKFNQKFIELQMKDSWHPQPWLNYNRYQLLNGLSKINKKLPKADQITLGFIDMEFSWENMTPEKYKHFTTIEMNSEFSTREKIMAENFSTLYSSQPQLNNARKALIITSREYAGKQTFTYLNKETKRQAGYIKDKYGDKVKTIALNWYKWMPLDWQTHILPNKTNGLSVDGKWDAVFEMTDYKPVGFSLKESPFGKDEYDYPYKDELKWEEVFDGFIFYEPYYRHMVKIGFPFELNSKQAKEILRRTMIYDKANQNKKNVRLIKWFGWIAKNQIKKDYSRQREIKCINVYPNSMLWKEDMRKWIENESHNDE